MGTPSEIHPLVWRLEPFGLTHQLMMSNLVKIAQRRGLVLRSLNPITKEPSIAAMVLGRSTPHPGLRGIKEKIGRFEVAVENTPGMRVIQGRGNLFDQEQGFAKREDVPFRSLTASNTM